jgi:Txe/YoeB family toxin of toxin-antitoxin system
MSLQADKDEEIARRAGYGAKFAEIMNTIRKNPFEPTPGHHFEKLKGKLKDHYSRRISYHDRFIYTVHPNTENAVDEKNGKPYDGIVRVHRAWGHNYNNIKQ